jgi:nitroreductase
MDINDFQPDQAPTFRYSEPAAAVDFDAFEKVVRSRRSIRVFQEGAIPEETMQRCLDMALLAPNSSNLQTWEFYWVRTPELRRQLNDACLSQPAVTTAAEVVVLVARPDRWKENRKRMLKHLGSRDQVPHVYWDYYAKLVPLAYSQGFCNWIGWCKKIAMASRGFFKPTPREPSSHHHMAVWSVKSTALAAQNLMLAFRASGFDSCPLEGLDSSRVKKLLRLPRKAIVVMAIAAGRRDPQRVYGPQLRFDRELFVHEV